MYVGVAIYEVHIGHARSLKDKRGVIRSILAKIRNRLDVSAAEVAFQNLHQRGRLGVAVVSADRQTVDQILDDVAALVEQARDAVLAGMTKEILPFDEDTVLLPGRGRFD